MFSPQLNIEFPCEQLNQSYFSDLRLLKNCVLEIVQLTNAGASSSNVYRIKTKDNRVFFLKLFITEVPEKIESLKNVVRSIEDIEGETKEETSKNFIKSMMEKPKLKSFCVDTERMNRNIQGMLKERMLYQEYINKMSDYNICPFFIKMVGSENNVHVNTILDFLAWVHHDENGNSIPFMGITTQVMRNVSEFLQTINKHSLHQHWNIISMNDLQKVRFSYIITNTLKNGTTLLNFITKFLKRLKKQQKSFQIVYTMLLYILFQVFLSTLILDCCSIFHSDLHFKNILVSSSKSASKIVCKFDRNIQTYELNYPLTVKIFDFDYSYIYNAKSANCIGRPVEFCKNNTSQFKMVLAKFIYHLINLPEWSEFSGTNEPSKFYDYVNNKIIKHFLKNTKFIGEYFYEKLEQFNIDENDTIDAFYQVRKQCDFELLTDKTINENFNSIEYIMNKIYNDPDFTEFNKPRTQNVDLYYVSKDMFDDFGTFLFAKQNEFKVECNKHKNK
jgi:hypothetical protein